MDIHDKQHSCALALCPHVVDNPHASVSISGFVHSKLHGAARTGRSPAPKGLGWVVLCSKGSKTPALQSRGLCVCAAGSFRQALKLFTSESTSVDSHCGVQYLGWLLALMVVVVVVLTGYHIHPSQTLLIEACQAAELPLLLQLTA